MIIKQLRQKKQLSKLNSGNFKAYILILILFLFLCLNAVKSFAQEFTKMLSVSSSIELSSEGKPKLKAGTFTIPEGFVATNLVFIYFDPVNDVKKTKLHHTNIYDINLKKHINPSNEIKAIPAGNYSLSITGEIGSCAILVYDLEREPQDNKRQK